MTRTQVDLTERNAHAAQFVLKMLVPGQATRVWTMTDEQILVLDDPDAPVLVDQTWLPNRLGDPANPEMIALAQEVALRGMVACGEVQIAVEESEISEVIARPEITGSLVLRRLGNALLRAARVTVETVVLAYFYVLEEGPVFEEIVDQNGMHEFGIYDRDLWLNRLADFLDPAEGAGLRQVDEVVSSDILMTDIESHPELSDALAVTNVTAVLRGDETPRVATIFSSHTGTYWLREESGLAEGTLHLTGVDRSDLERLAVDLTRS